MQSKFTLKKVVASAVFLFSAFVLQASAQGLFNVSANNGNLIQRYPSYMMGTVNINGGSFTQVKPATNTSTNIPPDQVVTTTCVPYLTTFHKYGDKNPDVAKLQAFLNKYNGANLNTKGYFGPATQKEVKNFQYTYGVKITGAQYQKTTEVINKLNCGQLAKKDRQIYVGQKVVATANTLPKTTIAKNFPLNNVYPNAPQTETITPKGVVNSIPKKPVESLKLSTTSTSTDDLFGNFKSDFDRIKENYKAYVLVFVLVLALFWFLRKAATE